jgi:aspartate racemase
MQERMREILGFIKKYLYRSRKIKLTNNALITKRMTIIMKTIGLIGGMSWESTTTYYKIINRVIKEKLGGFHSAKCILYSVDFHQIEAYQTAGGWSSCGRILADAASSLEKAGADFIVICTNTMHKVVDTIKSKISIPILHIADMTAHELTAQGIRKVALLGTKYTMEQDFYKDRLKANGIEVLIPTGTQRDFINDTIYHELCLGMISATSKATFVSIINSMSELGAQGVILGCTEIGLLVSQTDTDVKLFDTAAIHAEQTALFSLS